jgi:hypothetical protein
VEEETNIDLVNKEKKNHKYANLVEEGMSSNVEVQNTKNLSISTNKHLMINKETQVWKEDIVPKVKQENTTSMIRKDHVTRTPYRHPNHRS